MTRTLVQKEIETRTQEAVTLSIVNSGCLWWLTWMQFVTVFFYGLPLFPGNIVRNLWYYVPPDGWPINLPKMFLIVTIMAVMTLILGTPIMLAGSKAKIRQCLLLLIFSSIAVGFSLAIVRSEASEYQNAKKLLEFYRGDDLPYWAESRKDWEVPLLEDVIDAYLKSKH